MSDMLAPTVKAEAILAVLDQSFACRDPEIPDELGRRLVHCRGDIFGADWDEAGVIDAIRKATHVGWVDRLDSHNLAVKGSDGKTWWFQVTRPAEAGEQS